MDRHIEESGCYDNKATNVHCKICNLAISQDELAISKQDDGSYICPACQHDADAEKHREEMGRD